ncbi:hypothetical protein PINS_up006557 [Pythium insidiosum]|nr:hypothetical protein PINS_up006557 [Pythium insidiosum]
MSAMAESQVDAPSSDPEDEKTEESIGEYFVGGTSTTNSSSSSGTVPVMRKKTSRYLREMDRRAILERLANGEKQAALAKEFQVSRAAICNLYKHRDEVLSRVGESPFTKHPKKRKSTRSDPVGRRPEAGDFLTLQQHSISPNSTPQTAIAAAQASSSPPPPSSSPSPSSSSRLISLGSTSVQSVREIKSKSIELLLTSVRDCSSTDDQFRRASERLLWLLMEEALASVEITTTEIASSLNDGSLLPVARFPACAVTLEQRSCPMLDVFQLIQPDAPTAYVRLQSSSGNSSARDNNNNSFGSDAMELHVLDAHLPPQLLHFNVFLLDVVMASGETLRSTIQYVKARGAQDHRIFVVSLFLSSDAVAMVQSKFPQVTLLTTHIDSAITKRSNRNAWYSAMLQRLDRIYGSPHELLTAIESTGSP